MNGSFFLFRHLLIHSIKAAIPPNITHETGKITHVIYHDPNKKLNAKYTATIIVQYNAEIASINRLTFGSFVFFRVK